MTSSKSRLLTKKMLFMVDSDTVCYTLFVPGFWKNKEEWIMVYNLYEMLHFCNFLK